MHVSTYVKVRNERGIRGVGVSIQIPKNPIHHLYLKTIKKPINKLKYRFRRKFREGYLGRDDSKNRSERSNILVLMGKWEDPKSPTTQIFDEIELAAVIEKSGEEFRVIASSNEILWKIESIIEVEDIEMFDLS